MRIFYVFVVNAMLLVALVGCNSSGTSPKGLEVPIEKAAFKFADDVKDSGYKLVGTEELKKWLDEGRKMTIISTLPATDDKAFGTLPSSVNGAMPKTEKELTQADKDNILKAAGSDKEKTIVIYCGFVACRRSHIGAKILVENGFQNVYRYPGGITAWHEMSYPITK
ncbi:MAG TPA: rhodanese-like domain-containing protein [Nitrospirota bacterium]|nr:rhodanese-like domain-containing protein [Nitrospirota bacterium]